MARWIVDGFTEVGSDLNAVDLNADCALNLVADHGL